MIQLLCDREIQSYVGWFQSNHSYAFSSQWLDRKKSVHLSTVISLVYLIVWYIQPGKSFIASYSKTGGKNMKYSITATKNKESF